MLAQACTAMPSACSVGSRSWSRGLPVGRRRLPGLRGRATSARPAGVAFAASVFEPLKEILKDLLPQEQLPQAREDSARVHFPDSCESAINDQIHVLYSVSYIYHGLFAYCDRDNVALPGFAQYFLEESDHRRQRAEELMIYQNKRGGRVELNALLPPRILEFDEVLKALKLVDSLEKLTTEKFYALQQAAEDAGDKHLSHLIKSEYLAEQIEIVKRVSDYVAQVRRIGEEDGLGIYNFDRVLGEEEA